MDYYTMTFIVQLMGLHLLIGMFLGLYALIGWFGYVLLGPYSPARWTKREKQDVRLHAQH